MASATQVRRLRFAVQLRAALDENSVSIRGLARTLNPESPETARSNLSRWLRGAHIPSRSSRRAVAVALGMPADHFCEDDDEESDLVVDLFKVIQAIVRDEARKVLA